MFDAIRKKDEVLMSVTVPMFILKNHPEHLCKEWFRLFADILNVLPMTLPKLEVQAYGDIRKKRS